MTDWTNDQATTLRRLWDEGHSGAEIARQMGMTKNAVVGRAHRMDLPSRPSPIGQPKRELDDAQRGQLAQMIGKGFTRDQCAAVLRVGRDIVSREAKRLGLGGARHRGQDGAGVVLRARQASALAQREGGGAAEGSRARGAAGGGGASLAPAAHAAPAAAVGAIPVVVPLAVRAAAPIAPRGCRWPMWGNAEKPTHRYCDAPSCRGAYCAEHGARAFTATWSTDAGYERRPGGFVVGGVAA